LKIEGECLTEKKAGLQKSITILSEPTDIPKPMEQLSEMEMQRKQCVSKIMTHMLSYFTSEFVKADFEWLLPVVFSRCTDPLWPDPGASIEKRIEVEIYGKTARTTLSMIIHKMVACSLAYPKLFALSPNVRIEKRERANTGRHVYEFTQLDFEVRNATSEDIRNFVEGMICGLIKSLKKNLSNELARIGRYDSLHVPETPFRVYDKKDLETKYGSDWETKLPLEISDPVWVTNVPREFYDFEEFEDGKWDNYDLILPRFGEVLSGARREWEYDKIVSKMERDKVRKEDYETLLKLAREKRLKPCSGAGIGLERLISWIVGAKHIGETQPFPRVPGVVYDL
jgi:asparaginyl-tRNA synthetase